MSNVYMKKLIDADFINSKSNTFDFDKIYSQEWISLGPNFDSKKQYKKNGCQEVGHFYCINH